MQTEKEIKDIHATLHDSLSEDYYQNKLMSKEDFDYYHGQNWEDMETELIAKGYLTIPEPPRDLLAKITALKAEQDELKARLDKITKVNGVA